MHSGGNTALICSSWYKYSATVQPLWLPGSCQRLLARLSHQSSSFFLPIFRCVNGPHCAQSAVLPLAGCLSLQTSTRKMHRNGLWTRCDLQNAEWGITSLRSQNFSIWGGWSGSRSTELYFCDVTAESYKSNLVLVIFKQWDRFIFHRKVFIMFSRIVIYSNKLKYMLLMKSFGKNVLHQGWLTSDTASPY